MSREPAPVRSTWYMAGCLLLGLALGLVYAWMISPAKYVDVSPAFMSADFKDQYRLMIASAYMTTGDLGQAEERLAALSDPNPAQALTDQAQRALTTGDPGHSAPLLTLLAQAIQQKPILPLSSTAPAAAMASPLSTPLPNAPVRSVVNLPDASRIVINGDSEISLSSLAGLGLAGTDNALIKSGEILVISTLPSGSWFTVSNTRGSIGQVTSDPLNPGAIMLVTYDSLTGKFTVICIRGICELGPDAAHLTKIPLGKEGWLDQGGNFQGPSAFDLNAINASYGKYIQAGLTATTAVTATQTPIPTATSTFYNLPGTATAVCHLFHSLHPATPCP